MLKTFRFNLLLLIVLFYAISASAAEIRVSVATSLADAVKELVRTYQQAHPEAKIISNFASSGALAKQIIAGAPADIYISANPKWMKYLQEKDKIATDLPRVLVHNRLVFVGLETSKVKTLPDLLNLKRIAIGSPKSTPVGRYAEQALTSAGIYSQLQAANQLVLAKDVRQALMYADRGEVGGSFVYHTDALLAQQAKILFAVPQGFYPQVIYPTALTAESSGNIAAEQFFNYLFTEQAQQIFDKYGFLIPE